MIPSNDGQVAIKLTCLVNNLEIAEIEVRDRRIKIGQRKLRIKVKKYWRSRMNEIDKRY